VQVSVCRTVGIVNETAKAWVSQKQVYMVQLFYRFAFVSGNQIADLNLTSL